MNFSLDRKAVINASRKSLSYDPKENLIARRTGSEVLDRLKYLNMRPSKIVDLGCGAGLEVERLIDIYPEADIFGFDLCSHYVVAHGERSNSSFITADANKTPFSSDAFDLVFSNLVFSAFDVQSMLIEAFRIMRQKGAIVFATFGPDTLVEIHSSWLNVDGYPHVHNFLDMHDLGDMLVNAGFSEPVLDVEMVTLTYKSVKRLVQDLRYLGCTNSLAERRRGLTGRGIWANFVDALFKNCQDLDKLGVSFELIYGIAWMPAQKVTSPHAQFVLPPGTDS